MAELTPKVFQYSDIEVAWTGDHDHPLIDIDLRADFTVAARLSLTPEQALALAHDVFTQLERIYRKG